ncbi:Metal dependent phosphohydrolase [Candidatus Desulfosporosinus infrequens]|uniref:Metal dependent phosphohydrolase n=1 Tax=Candidatus Desulfosporosinus infrequens TaxID=2043169 RepID=A0A2U3LNQ5_9FIRM|nr:Metal dependent phosphohydrolase [Candidatus Desulfosporosinus infrequens]
MRLVKIEEAVRGNIVAKTLNSTGGTTLIRAGAILTDKMIELIKVRGFSYLYIEDESNIEVVEDVVRQELRLEAIGDIQKLTVAIIAAKISLSRDLYSHLLNIINLLVKDLSANTITIINLIDLKNHDDYTFVHSVNVTILCLMVGISLGYPTSTLKELGMGAILHDVGKKEISSDILNKTSQLTKEEYDIIKQHPQIGYEKVKNVLELGAVGRSVILQHHEKLDGTGYPAGKKVDSIHEFARIATIADVYDALTSDRPYRKRYTPSHALEYLYGACGSHFDLRLVKIFADHIAPYPVGCRIKLSSGESAIVSDISANRYRPIVRVGKNQIDLCKQLNTTIIDVLM